LNALSPFFYIVEYAIEPQNVAELEINPAKKTILNPHYRKITHLYSNNVKTKSPNNFVLLVQTFIQNSMKMREIMLYCYIVTTPMETKDKGLLGSG
jgi:hypothetical protein